MIQLDQARQGSVKGSGPNTPGFGPVLVSQPSTMTAITPRADRIRFGREPYGTIFSRATLTPTQQVVADGILALTQARTLANLPAHLNLLQHPQYEFLTTPKGRQNYHSPFTELYFNLNQDGERNKLVERLQELAVRTPSRLAQQNTATALADIYFYATRPGGELSKTSPGPRLERLNNQVLTALRQVIETDTPAGKLVHNALRYRWHEVSQARFWQPQSIPEATFQELQVQLAPLLNNFMAIDASSETRRHSARALMKLEEALAAPDAAMLRQMSQSSELTQLIPAWQRLLGPNNTQHSRQDHDLSEHTLAVVEGTKRSPYYNLLSPAQKRLVSAAALLHDIGKQTGPANLRPVIPVDTQHALRCRDIAREVLPSLGFNATDTERVSRLILHHTLLGTMNMNFTQLPPEPILEAAATRLGTPEMLDMLLALTEGDIRGVRRGGVLYTPETDRKLADISSVLRQKMQQNLARAPYLPRTDWDDVLRQHLRANPPKSVRNLTQSLYEIRQPAVKSLYSVEEGISTIRLPGNVPHSFVTLPVEALNATSRNQPSVSEGSLYTLTAFQGAEAAALPKVQLLVELLPEDLAWVGRQPSRPVAFSRNTRPPISAEVSRERDSQAALYQAVARAQGFEQWSDAFRFLVQEEAKPLRSPRYQQLMEALRQVQAPAADQATLPLSAWAATSPTIKAILYRQGQPNEPIILPDTALRLMKRARLPLIVLG